MDPMLLWLWRRPVAKAPIGPLAWEPPYAAREALEKAKKKKRKLVKSSLEKERLKSLADTFQD